MSLLALIALVASPCVEAKIGNSQYSERHQNLLKKAIYQACGARGRITQLSNSEYKKQIDQGVVDTFFNTEYAMEVIIDQGVRDFFRGSAQTANYSAYDHDAKDWGIYELVSVSCELQ